MDEKEKLDAVYHWRSELAGHPDGTGIDVSAIPSEVVDALIEDPDVPASVIETLAKAMEAAGAVSGAPGDAAEAPPAGDDDGSEEYKESAVAAANRARKEKEEKEQKEQQAKKISLVSAIMRMDIGEKAKLARQGDKDARAILIKEGNKLISGAVLDNPRITIQEIEMISSSRNVNEDILRAIGNNRDWCKEYKVILNLVNNPKTPVGISLTHLNRIQTRDLRFLAKSKGIPDALKVTAKKLAQKKTI
ncbi:MAG: hypothetical protein HZA22_13860 [Nitrospirae bacterium]|nr:hypothetical protein [Nitrospirota bacterium]MBI5696312.1 hypothetical protein [Nitrospirota bacterium]